MRKCSGVLAFNKKGKVCIIRGTAGGWVLPKGGIVKHLTPAQNALKEAYEEAGIIGILKPGDPVHVQLKKSKIDFFLMEVALATKDWPERWRRNRNFVSVEKARKKLGPEYSKLLDLVA